MEKDMRMQNRWRSRVSLLLIAAFLVGAVSGAPAAQAQNATDDPSAAQYEPPLADDGGTAGSVASSGSGLDGNIGSLPFTGLDLLTLLGIALLLTGTGFALRRPATPRGP
jgi:hypothetical protein